MGRQEKNIKHWRNVNPIISALINGVDAQPSNTLRRTRKSYGQN